MKKISVTLNKLEELFQETEFDPFNPDSRCESGIADLFNQTQKIPRKELLQLAINIQGSNEVNKTKDEIQDAIQRYCEVQISHSEREILEIRQQGIRDIGWASLISILLLLGAYFITLVTSLPEIIIYLLSTGAGIIAWVALWPPLDSIFYEWSPYRQTKLRYEQLKSAQVLITNASPAAIKTKDAQ
jgi:hypothetical protein